MSDYPAAKYNVNVVEQQCNNVWTRVKTAKKSCISLQTNKTISDEILYIMAIHYFLEWFKKCFPITV